MTKDQILAALQSSYDAMKGNLLGSSGACGPSRYTGTEQPSRVESIAHLLWMIIEVRTHLKEDKLEKAFRWLGFIQGALWSVGIQTIDEARHANMPEGDVFTPRSVDIDKF